MKFQKPQIQINSVIEKFTSFFENSEINYVLRLSEKTLAGFFSKENPHYVLNKNKGLKNMPHKNLKGKIVLIHFTGKEEKNRFRPLF